MASAMGKGKCEGGWRGCMTGRGVGGFQNIWGRRRLDPISSTRLFNQRVPAARSDCAYPCPSFKCSLTSHTTRGTATPGSKWAGLAGAAGPCQCQARQCCLLCTLPSGHGAIHWIHLGESCFSLRLRTPNLRLDISLFVPTTVLSISPTVLDVAKQATWPQECPSTRLTPSSSSRR